MHVTNQEMIANHLLQQVGGDSISNFMLLLMVEMFGFEEKSTICLHHLEGEHMLKSPGTAEPTKKGLRLDPDYCDSHIELDESLLIASCTTTTKWCTVLASEGFSSGLHKWDVVIDKCTNTCNIMIGVCEKNQNLAYYIGQDTAVNGWAYYGCNGYLYHGGGSKQYGTKLKQGDIITVELDLDNGTVTFAKNGSSFGIAFSTGLEDKEVFPAVSLYDMGDSVSFVDGKKDSSKSPGGSPTILDFKLNLNSPLRFHRVGSLFQLPVRTTIDELATKLIGGDNRDKKSAKFYLINKSGRKLLENISLKDLVTEGEILDIGYITENTPSSPITSEVQNKDNVVTPILQIFSSKGGLGKLINLLYNEYKRTTKVDKNEELIKKKKWLKELRAHVQVPGYFELFTKNTHCRALLFRAMKNGKETSEDQTIPKNILENPFEPLYTCLFQLFSNPTTVPDPSGLLKQALDSGVLKQLLNRLSTLCSVEHKNPGYFDKKKAIKEPPKTPSAKVERKNPESRQEYWAKGTGFGTSADDKLPVTWTHAEYAKQQEVKSQQIDTLFQGINAFLALPGEQPAELGTVLADSCLVPALEGYLRNDSVMEMVRFKALHMTVLQLVKTITSKEDLVGIIVHNSNVSSLLERLNTIAQILLKTMAQSKQRLANLTKTDSKSGSPVIPVKQEKQEEKAVLSEDGEEAILAKEITNTAELAKERIEIWKHHNKKAQALAKALEHREAEGNNPLLERYKAALQVLQFDELSMQKKGQYVHHYKSKIEKDEVSGATSDKIKRLIQEVGAMSTSLPIYLESSIFVRVDSERIDVMQALITGPVGTPYANGCFQFDIYCTPEYPKAPPLVNLQTTGGGSVRFNPNLYNCGKVCLSLLGTWKGSENEKWNSKTSTLLQVLISIQSLILVDEPYFNEPGYETEIGKPSGIQHSREYNENIRAATMKWAMLEQLKRPSPGFEEVIKNHFKIKRAEILKQCHEWVKEGSTSKTGGYHEKIKKTYEELQKELQKLDPDVPLELPEDINEAEKKEKAEKEAKKKELVKQLQEILPGHPQNLYVQALDANEDKIEPALNWLLEKTAQ